MLSLNLSNKMRKILYLVFNAIGVAAILLIILVPSCLTQVGWKKSTYTTEEQLLIVLMVIIPFMGSLICFLLAGTVKIFTKEDAIRQLEIQFSNGVISFDQYQATYQHIENFDFEKRKLKAELLIKQKTLKDEMVKKANEEIKKTIETEEKQLLN